MRIKYAFFLFVVALLTACNRTNGSSTPQLNQTITPTAQASMVILIVPADMPNDQSNLYETTVYDLAYQNSMRFKVLNTLTLEDIALESSSLKVVIVLPPDPGLASLITAAPQVHFLAIGITDLPVAQNLTTIGIEGTPIDQQAFLAGYTAAMVSDDYRVGVISLRDDARGQAVEKAFINGVRFYCGLCQRLFPPWYDYPIYNEIPIDTSKELYPAYGDWLIDHLVDVAYIYPEIATPELMDRLAQGGMKLIGETMPRQDLQPNWIISIAPQIIPAIQLIFPDLVAGQGGQNLATPLFLVDVNPDLLSEGKQRLVQEVLDDLQAGKIDTGVTIP